MNARKSRPVLLLGSIPLESPAAVFEAVAGALGGLMRRIPDGETGARSQGITFQGEYLRNARGVDLLSERTMPDGTKRPVLAAKPGTTTAGVQFGPCGYADAALQSYGEFQRLRDAGTIPAGVRFQVSLPTPVAVVFGFFARSSVRTVWPAYERRILLELDRIVRGIPSEDLAIQWDLSAEIARVLEFPEVAKVYPAEELANGVGRVCDNVPAEIELGLHLCYGDIGHRHLVEPRDTGLMVEFVNLLAATIERSLTWVHMPVPRDRDDDEYFAPLQELRIAPSTELYLGLVHLTDGIEGAERRLAAARRAIEDFGVAAECGLGRRPPETIPALLALHRAVAELEVGDATAPSDEDRARG